jgi:hypothetical protein
MAATNKCLARNNKSPDGGLPLLELPTESISRSSKICFFTLIEDLVSVQVGADGPTTSG